MKTSNKAHKERVYKCAEAFIGRYGIKGWNMNDLAGAAGITKRTLYKIIESKEQLVHDVVFEKIYESRDYIFDVLQSGGDFRTSLEKIIAAIPELLNRNLINNNGDIFREYPAIEEQFVRENRIFFSQMRDFLQSGIDSGNLIGDITPDFIYQTFQAILIHFIKYSSSQSEAAEKVGLALRCMYRGTITGEKK